MARRGDADSKKPRLIDRQNRVALPPDVLAALKLEAGDYVVFEIEDGKARLHKVKWTPER